MSVHTNACGGVTRVERLASGRQHWHQRQRNSGSRWINSNVPNGANMVVGTVLLPAVLQQLHTLAHCNGLLSAQSGSSIPAGSRKRLNAAGSAPITDSTVRGSKY